MPPLEPVEPAPSGRRGRRSSTSAAPTSSTSTTSRACKQYLIDGESYEVCLTNKVRTDLAPEPLPLYRTLRHINPAPFSAYLRFGEASVLSSSPERFLSVGRDRWVEAKPIKGTDAPRRRPRPRTCAWPRSCAPTRRRRAENLMITDLLRNDLGVVCDIGTVHVPHLMAIESFETVHQLVSTVRGRLRDDVEPPDGIRACFPGGSMTGAPKKRTMEIIDELEGEARGVYSGAIGYLGLSGGCDLNIVIRTIVMDGETTTIGTGGAIVMQSDHEAEYQEIMLKARALINALAVYAAPDGEIRVHEARVAADGGGLGSMRTQTSSTPVTEMLRRERVELRRSRRARARATSGSPASELARPGRAAGGRAVRARAAARRSGGAAAGQRARVRGRVPRRAAGRRGRGAAEPSLQGARARVPLRRVRRQGRDRGAGR